MEKLNLLDNSNQLVLKAKEEEFVQYGLILISDFKEMGAEIDKFELIEGKKIEIEISKHGQTCSLSSNTSGKFKIEGLDNVYEWACISGMVSSLFNLHLGKVMTLSDLKEEYETEGIKQVEVEYHPNEGMYKLLNVVKKDSAYIDIAHINPYKANTIETYGADGMSYSIESHEDGYMYTNLRYGFTFKLSFDVGIAFFENQLKHVVEEMKKMSEYDHDF